MSQKCAVCNNITTDPSGRCYLHQGAIADLSNGASVGGLPNLTASSGDEMSQAEYREILYPFGSVRRGKVFTKADDPGNGAPPSDAYMKTIYDSIDQFAQIPDWMGDDAAADRMDQIVIENLVKNYPEFNEADRKRTPTVLIGFTGRSDEVFINDDGDLHQVQAGGGKKGSSPSHTILARRNPIDIHNDPQMGASVTFTHGGKALSPCDTGPHRAGTIQFKDQATSDYVEPYYFIDDDGNDVPFSEFTLDEYKGMVQKIDAAFASDTYQSMTKGF